MPLLFSYGTLQRDDIQLSTFGRLLHGDADALPGFDLGSVTIGGSTFANVIRGGGIVRGMVFEVTEDELDAADEYEGRDEYARIAVTLESGREAWVYFKC